MVTYLVRLYSWQSLGMVIVQVTLGSISLKMLSNRRNLYAFRDIYSIRSILLLLGLVGFSFLMFFGEGFVNAYLYYEGSWDLYGKAWRATIQLTPIWARYMNALVVPFTAGFFEEAIWRGYGISALERSLTTKRAIVIQALAFGLWHVNPIHVIVTFVIGLLYGYVFVMRRRLLLLTLSHIITNAIGFNAWLVM
jgi:membrane protease YdiL (CAAX protease family)